MPTYPVVDVIDGEPTFEKPLADILKDMKKGWALQTLSPVEFITTRQRNWYKGICLRDLVKNDPNGETLAWWDQHVKRKCDGMNLLKIEYKIWFDKSITARLTTKGVGKKNMTMFIEEILSKSLSEGWNISPPDADLRKK
ncbi:MAG: hypothetical protein KAS32_14070 [Candidatus Peribacteraceae bacterium]|nr:hypothetical protein [Candidatus Peribacteraceae bacterium]